MKKSIFLLAAFVLLAASCTKTELVSSGALSSQKGIGFSAYTAKPTKAAQTDVKTDNFNSFEVTAIGNNAVYFDNVPFTKNGEGVWASTPVYFWPAYALNFYAYNTPADGNGTFTRNITTTAPQTLTYSPAAELAKQEDLVAAYAANQTDPSGATDLFFNHYLTQVVVNAKNSSTGYEVEVYGVKLANLAGEGTYTFSTGNMVATAGKVNSATSSDYTSNFTVKTLTADAQEVMVTTGSGKWYLVPQTVTAWDQAGNKKNTSHGTYIALNVKITAPNGVVVYPTSGESAWMAVPVPSQLAFEQGKKYNVTVDFFSTTGGGAGYVDPENPGELDRDTNTDDSGKKIIGGAIKFDASVTPWDAVEVLISL